MKEQAPWLVPPPIHIEVSGPSPEDVGNIILRIEKMLTEEFKRRPDVRIARTTIDRQVSPTVQQAFDQGAVVYPLDSMVDLRAYNVTIVGRLRE